MRAKRFKQLSRYKPDSYGYLTNDQGRRVRRHPKCKCEVACQMRFQCRSRHHKGSRSTPWCNGCWDNMPEVCDTCWGIETKRREKIQEASQARWNY